MTLRVVAGLAPPLLFEKPERVWAPLTFDGALDAVMQAQQSLEGGYWIAGAISYEFGAMLQGIGSRTCDPLLLLGAYKRPERVNFDGNHGRFSMTAPLARIGAGEYEQSVRHILSQIEEGEVYQVNYTVPFDLGFSGDAYALFRFLARRAHAPYSAFVETTGRAIVSISPELFLRFEGNTVSTKPMKGTAALDSQGELSDGKNQAEHLMIVDLLRNDLHRLCDRVDVRRLFEIERYPTFATMTSTIAGKLCRRIDFLEILRATFPCGSVTGAPKRAAMQHIDRIERFPREFYTGTIGYLSPQRRGWWNVPIRTLQLDLSSNYARYDAGGGIVCDSKAAGEWQEILVKSRFLRPAFEQFALLESFRAGPDPSDIDAHLRRLSQSACAFGIDLDLELLREKLGRTLCASMPEFVRVRARTGSINVTAESLERTNVPVDVCISRHRVSSADPLLRHKTAWRPIHAAAAREALVRGCFDAILQNERGEITEGARTNIFVRMGNMLYTPPIACGVLPGILREQLVRDGQAAERVLTAADLQTADAVYAGNSARGLLVARMR